MSFVRKYGLVVANGVGTSYFWISMLIGLLHSVKGINLSWLMLGFCFVLLNIWLQCGALHQISAMERDKQWYEKRRAVWQALFIYCLAGSFNVVNLVVLLLNGGRWNEVDSITCLLVAGGLLVTMVQHRAQLTSTEARGWYAGVLKSIPQFFLAYSLFQAAGGAMRWDTNIAQHAIGWMRLAQVVVSYVKKRESSTLASMVSEILNMISLITISLAMWLGPLLSR